MLVSEKGKVRQRDLRKERKVRGRGCATQESWEIEGRMKELMVDYGGTRC